MDEDSDDNVCFLNNLSTDRWCIRVEAVAFEIGLPILEAMNRWDEISEYLERFNSD